MRTPPGRTSPIPPLAGWAAAPLLAILVAAGPAIAAGPAAAATAPQKAKTAAKAKAKAPARPGKAAPAAKKSTAPAPKPPAASLRIISSSHQDIAWMDSPEKCAAYRDENVITPALEMMARDPSYRFTMENMLNLSEYLERHPERRDEVRRYTEEGRLEWGATFNQPYESLLSGEQLVRETYFGRRWLRKTFPGADARVAFNPDVPARSLQMSQILSKAGIPYLLISRFHEGFYRWASPDGSSVLAFSPGHYGNAAEWLNAPPGKGSEAIAARLAAWKPRYAAEELPAVYPLLNSVDFSKPTDFGPLIAAWNGRPALAIGGSAPVPPPAMGYSTARGFFEALDVPAAKLPVIAGERPDLWLYIHGPTHHWAITAQREAGYLLPAAEAFAAFRTALEKSPASYPSERLDAAWRASIFPDHGWGGKEGQITDRLFRESYESARDEGRAMLGDALVAIAGRVKPLDLSLSTYPQGNPSLPPQGGAKRMESLPIIVFNSLSWNRSAPVVCEFERGEGGFSIIDADGKQVPYQVLPDPLDPATGAPPATIRVEFAADGVPGLGYKSWRLLRDKSVRCENAPVKVVGDVVENDFYRMVLAPGGVKSLTDKTTGREILRTDKFLGFEVFTMRSVGNGAGEFGRVQPVDMEGFDKLSLHAPAWRLDPSRSGVVKTVFVLEQRLPHVTVRESLALYHGVKRLDCEVELLGWDGEPYREFRLAVPVDAPDGRVAYEVPMGVVEVGASEAPTTGGPAYGSLVYDQEFKDIRPREVGRFLTASGGGIACSLSPSVAVCDYLDPTPDPASYPILQPILLASRRSCHGEGNWYLQEGDHRYRFALTTQGPDWRRGWREAIGADVPMFAVVGAPAAAKRDLTPETSFLRVTPENVLVSAVKKAEDDGGLVLRVYEIEGRDSAAAVETEFAIGGLERTDLIEENGKPWPFKKGSFALPVGHHAIETLKVLLK